MKEMKIKVIGTAPLLMHNPQTVDPLNRYDRALKEITSKRTKTDDDHHLIARIEWEAALYLKDGRVVIPERCINACFWSGAKKTKNGVKWQSGAMIAEEESQLDYEGPIIKVSGNGNVPNPELEIFFKKHHDRRLERIKGNGIMRTRPIFFGWSFETIIQFDESVLNKSTIKQIVTDAGRLCGLLEKRPRLGRFEYEILK